MLGPQPAPPSPLLRRRSLVTRTHVLEVPLADLRAAAKTVGGSVNDAYLAALSGGLGRYHEALGVPVDELPLALPVSLRTADDPAAGNRFAGVTIAAPVGEPDPAERIRLVREQVIARRGESAIGVLDRVAPVLTLLPDAALESVTNRITPPDIQASNVPGYWQETFLAGARVDRQYGMGPMPRVAMMAVLMSRAGICTLTVRYDTASFTDSDQLEKALQLGLDEVVDLGRPRRPAPGGVSAMTTTPSSGTDRQTRLPGSVAEVDASPKGPEIGAFFDLDGTLVAGYTVTAHTVDRLRRRQVGAGEFLRMTQLAVEYKLGRREFETVITEGARAARGRLAEDVEEMGERVFRQSIADLIYPEMRELVRAHQRRGHTVVLSSSALTFQAEPVARYLGIDHVVCNRFVVDEHGRADRRHRAPGDLGAHQGHQRAAVRRRAPDRPAVGLLLRRRRRGRRPHAPGRQPAADQPRARAGQGGRPPRLAHPAVRQPGQRRHARPGPRPGLDRLARARGRGRAERRRADPEQAERHQLPEPGSGRRRCSR